MRKKIRPHRLSKGESSGSVQLRSMPLALPPDPNHPQNSLDDSSPTWVNVRRSV